MKEVYMLKITLKAKLINATEFVTDKAREREERTSNLMSPTRPTT